MEPIKIVGVTGSPYSRKMRSILRYRRIPHVWIQRGSPEDRDLPPVAVDLMPVLVFPRGVGGAPESMIDSTFQLRRLEAEYPDRSLLPPDPALAFLDLLLEDFADEWLTKAMFHYRWAFAPDIAKAAAILPRWFATEAAEERQRKMGEAFAARQIARRGIIGSTPESAPMLEGSYRRQLALLALALEGQRFLFGARPSTADFAFFGQLTQLAQFDPTPAAVALQETPRVVAWVDVVEDLSGAEPSEADWVDRESGARRLAGLLGEVGRTYLPFLLANAAAATTGAATLICEIDGHRYEQSPFPYQVKCLRWLREARAALKPADRAWVDGVLADTGCAALSAPA